MFRDCTKDMRGNDMGFTEVLTIVFVVLKLFDVISWDWFLCLLPEIIAVSVYAAFTILLVMADRKKRK